MKQLTIFPTIFLAITLVSCGPFDYSESSVDPKAVIKAFTTSTNSFSLAADGASTIDISVELPFDAPADKRTVTFKTTKGVFEGIGKNETTAKAQIYHLNNIDKLLATVTLISTVDTGKAVVSAEIAEIVEKTTIAFVKAYPEAIRLTVDKLVIEAAFNSELNLTATLKRRNGVPSVGNVVSLNVVGNDNKSHGYFRNSQPNSTSLGETKFIFTLGNDTKPSSLTFTAAAIDAKGGIITDKVEIFKK